MNRTLTRAKSAFKLYAKQRIHLLTTFTCLALIYSLWRAKSNHEAPRSDERSLNTENGRLLPPLIDDDEDAWLRFTKSFTARLPEYQEWCESKLGISAELSSIGSQYQQDVFLIRNVFSTKILQGEPGFYLDAGANDAEKLSNTLFFDVCLGWSGLCIEPNEQYHVALQRKRSCQLVPLCISDKEENVTFDAKGASGHIGQGKHESSVTCAPLDVILDKYALGRRHVDFWSLDVEGHEMAVLGAVPWSKCSFTALLVETFWLSDRHVDRFMTELGYAKVHQLAIDSLYMKWNTARKWRPSLWDEHWQMNEEFRDRMRDQGRLSKKH
jgi:FkbM family methyltransferase